ncbi:MAG: c-type cytochrome [Candidatus Acidiferrales bacterium]
MNKRARLIILILLAAVWLTGCGRKTSAVAMDPRTQAYDVEADWNDPQHLIPLNYEQSQGKRIFYNQCVWCHADSTPAGPSNRSNLNPTPSLMNDGATLNNLSDEYMQNIISLGGSAMGKSGMMPPYGRTLTPDEIREVIAFTRAIAQPVYQWPVQAKSQISR